MIATHPCDNVQSLFPAQHSVLPGFKRSPFHDSILQIVSETGESLISSSSTKPFVSSHPSFFHLLGPSASVRVLASRPGTCFAHEAGVYTDGSVWFTSNLIRDGGDVRVDVSTVDLKTGRVEVKDVGVVTGNGACPYGDRILFCDQGSKSSPSSLTLVDPLNGESEVILNNFLGRPFNSLNDVIVLPPRGQPQCFGREVPEESTVWFTDPPYGHEQGFKPDLQLPPSVYVFHPSSGEIRVVADNFHHPNGIAFSPNGERCYITDTSHIRGCGRLNPGLESTIYEFDVSWPDGGFDDGLPSLTNRRVFAFADCGVPDGIKCDTLGNVYSGCGDGVHVWNRHGRLLGRIILGLADDNVGAGCANFCFVPGGRLVCFSEDRIYLVEGLNVSGALLNPKTS
nr:uncharacterized protein CI109_007066 [Kwoniella shandongensis]KAA5524578.1 hypothetical protein CI109_007066 [Kwoniella shandongensis]